MSRRKNKNHLIAGEDVAYCRKCRKVMSFVQFYEATNPMIDTNGKMSVCRDCCNEMYNTYHSIHADVEKAILLTCEDLDVRFSKDAVNQTRSHMEKWVQENRNLDKIFGVYKSKLGSLSKENEQITSFRFKDSVVYENIENTIEQKEIEIIDPKLKLFWGKKFTIEDLEYLEMELSNWKATHKCDNQAELVLIKEICIKQLEIMRDRDDGKTVTGKLDELQKLMKTASVDPAKSNVASAGKSQEAYGVWIKDIENLTPAEWYEQQEKYKDMDGFVSYINNYIVRPIKNFLTGERNFRVDENIDTNIDVFEGGDD
jgi:hypothetical protein